MMLFASAPEQARLIFRYTGMSTLWISEEYERRQPLPRL